MIDYEKIKRVIDDRLREHGLLNDVVWLTEEEERELLTQPKPKYAVGDTVWRLSCDNSDLSLTPFTAEFEIYAMEWREKANDFIYEDQFLDLQPEECLYPTRQSLIESQLMHWTKLLAEDGYPGTPLCAPSTVTEPKASCCSVHAGGNEECARHDNGCIDLIAHGMALREKVEECAREDDTHTKPEECGHEHDGSNFSFSAPSKVEFDLSKLKPFKCKKCGDYYR